MVKALLQIELCWLELDPLTLIQAMDFRPAMGQHY